MSMLRRRLSSVGEGIDSLPWIEVSVEGLQNCYLPVSSHMYIADITDMATGMKLNEVYVSIPNPLNPGQDVSIESWGFTTGRYQITWTDGIGGIDNSFSQSLYLNTAIPAFSTFITFISPGLLQPIRDTLDDVSEMFAGATRLTEIPSGLFRGCYGITDFSKCFWNCYNLIGRTPRVDGMELWERFPDANGEKCFEGCMQLDNYSSIPSSWK